MLLAKAKEWQISKGTEYCMTVDGLKSNQLLNKPEMLWF